MCFAAGKLLKICPHWTWARWRAALCDHPNRSSDVMRRLIMATPAEIYRLIVLFGLCRCRVWRRVALALSLSVKSLEIYLKWMTFILVCDEEWYIPKGMGYIWHNIKFAHNVHSLYSTSKASKDAIAPTKSLKIRSSMKIIINIDSTQWFANVSSEHQNEMLKQMCDSKSYMCSYICAVKIGTCSWFWISSFFEFLNL